MSLHLYKFVSRDIMSLYKSTSDTRESLGVGRAGVSGCIRAAAGESCWPAKSFVFIQSNVNFTKFGLKTLSKFDQTNY